MKATLPLLAAAAFLAGCSCVPEKIPLKGSLGPYRLETTVDSRYAAYFVEGYLAGRRTDPALDARLDSLRAEFAGTVPRRDALGRISEEFSVDFAALFWGHQVLSLPENSGIQDSFVRHLEETRAGRKGIRAENHLAILVPGLDYVKNGPVTGADLKSQIGILRELKVEVEFVAIPPLGSVEENAALVAQAIRSHPDRKLLVAGPSSAGPAIHLALAKLLSPEETRPVAAWVNLGGILQGSPVIDWMDAGITYPLWRTVLWSQGWRHSAFRSMRADESRKRAETLVLPGHIQVINYIGLSLSGDISRFAKDKYCIMRPLGPNDGLALLPDMMAPRSRTIVAPSSDHFFAEDPLIKEKTVSLLKTTLGLL